MNEDLFLEGAVARYKGFVYLIKRNKERSIRSCCVPTYDIDLIWHSHQLQPVSYCKDLVKILGKVLEHDDTDSDRTKGSKLDVGFSGTTKQWEETFGSRYWRAGTMFRGIVPSPLTTSLSNLDTASRKVVPSNDYENMIRVSEKMLVEVASTIFFTMLALFLMKRNKLQISCLIPCFSAEGIWFQCCNFLAPNSSGYGGDRGSQKHIS